MISRCRQATVWTLMTALRQCFGDGCATETGLTRTARVDVYQHASSFCRFVRKLSEKTRPSSIIDGLGQHPARQSFDVQILDGDHAVGVDQRAGNLMLEVGT